MQTGSGQFSVCETIWEDGIMDKGDEVVTYLMGTSCLKCLEMWGKVWGKPYLRIRENED